MCPHVSVNCPRCGDSISANQAESHAANVCALSPVTCAHCQMSTILRRDLDSHGHTCPSVPVHCPACDATVARSALEAHLDDSCLLVCSNAPCAAVCLGRRALAVHVASVCLESLVPCSFVDVGCESPHVRRADLGAHLESAQTHHIGLLAAANRVCLFRSFLCGRWLHALSHIFRDFCPRVNCPGAQARVTRVALSLDCEFTSHMPSRRCSCASASSLSSFDQRRFANEMLLLPKPRHFNWRASSRHCIPLPSV